MSIITIKWCTCTETAAPLILHSGYTGFHASTLNGFTAVLSERNVAPK